MSNNDQPAPAPADAQNSASLVKGEAPIAFKAPPNIQNTPVAGAPTTMQMCVDQKGHGGPKGNRWYYAGTGTKTPSPYVAKDIRICEICGTVDV